VSGAIHALATQHDQRGIGARRRVPIGTRSDLRIGTRAR